MTIRFHRSLLLLRSKKYITCRYVLTKLSWQKLPGGYDHLFAGLHYVNVVPMLNYQLVTSSHLFTRLYHVVTSLQISKLA